MKLVLGLSPSTGTQAVSVLANLIVLLRTALIMSALQWTKPVGEKRRNKRVQWNKSITAAQTAELTEHKNGSKQKSHWNKRRKHQNKRGEHKNSSKANDENYTLRPTMWRNTQNTKAINNSSHRKSNLNLKNTLRIFPSWL